MGTVLSATSPHTRIKGIELHERVARKFVDELLTGEPGQILRLADAYAVFRALLKQRDLCQLEHLVQRCVLVSNPQAEKCCFGCPVLGFSNP